MAIGSADNKIFHFNVQPSVNKLLRHLKKQESGLYNCINSVIEDVFFVKEIVNIYPSLTLVANLRCGLWYAPDCAGTCYFKSTDGHYGNWGFSNIRLNLHIAHLAAQEGGCLIVDATRRGKNFPVRMFIPSSSQALSSTREDLLYLLREQIHKCPSTCPGNYVDRFECRNSEDGEVAA